MGVLAKSVERDIEGGDKVGCCRGMGKRGGEGEDVRDCLKVMTGLLVVRGHLSLVRDVLECRLELNFD